jgi:hypothetical protein
MRTFARPVGHFAAAIGALLEIEAPNGARMMIPQHGIQLICEHTTQPSFRVLRRWPATEDGIGTAQMK